MTQTALLLLLAAAPDVATSTVTSASVWGDDQQSILPITPYRLQSRLHQLPLLDSYHLTLEHVAQPVVFQIEESGGFSDPDPAKFSIYGDSWVWNRWYLDGVDITDAFDAGAAAVQVPFFLVDRFELAYTEVPGPGRAQGVALTLADRPVGPVARVFTGAFVMGGKWPLAGPIMDAISGEHADDRVVPPPEARRRFDDTFELSIADSVRLGGYDLQLGLQAQQGTRRYLEYRTDGRLAETFDEDFAIATLGARLAPTHRRWSAWLVAEHRQRDHAFAELYHARGETAAQAKTSVLGGLRAGRWTLGLRYQRRTQTLAEADATREALDVDGESLYPFFSTGRQDALGVDVAYAGEHLYGHFDTKVLFVAPDQTERVVPVTLAGAPYGGWTLRTEQTYQAYGDARLGWADSFDLGATRMSTDVYGFGTYAVNQSHDNTLAMFDVGLEVALAPRARSDFSPFLTLARTPVAVTPELARLLDPGYLQGSLRLGNGQLLETRDAANITVDGLSPTDVYSGSTGFRWRLSDEVVFDAQGILKIYLDTYRLDLDGSEGLYGRRGGEAGDVFFFDDGETRYRLVNENETSLSYGLYLQLNWQASDDSFLTVGFSAFNAVGRPPFGNGPGANDLGVVTFDGANPNSRMNDLANLDSDRGFAVKASFAYRLVSNLWALATVRFRDGTPFSFFNRHFEDGQVASTYHSKRGSPLKLERPLDGPREDFHLNLDLGLRYTHELAGQPVTAFVLATNLLDMGNEIQEVSNGDGIGGRAALEKQIPRALFFGLTLGSR